MVLTASAGKVFGGLFGVLVFFAVVFLVIEFASVIAIAAGILLLIFAGLVLRAIVQTRRDRREEQAHVTSR